MNANQVRWLSCQKLEELLPLLKNNVSPRKLCLSAAACCRLHWDELPEPTQTVVAKAELWADALWTDDELARILPATSYYWEMWRELPWTMTPYLSWPSLYLFGACRQCLRGETGWQEACPRYCQLVREVVPSPFVALEFDPALAHWNCDTVLDMAWRMYDHGDFRNLPLLGDALEEAGCLDRRILMHCRGPGVHVRGCWVVDLILGFQ